MHKQLCLGARHALFAVIIGLLVGSANVSLAEGPNPHFDALIAELQARSASYSNSTDKVVIKTKKKVDKIIASFYKKPSISLDKDLKLAAKVSKKLTKLYPEEFAPAPTVTAISVAVVSDNLATLIEDVLTAYGGDIETILATAQDMVDSSLPGNCKDKARTILDEVAAQLALLDTAPDLPTTAKLMSKAAKTALKGQSAAEAALECLPDFGSNDWYTWILGMSVDGEPVSLYEDARDGEPDELILNYFNSGWMTCYAFSSDGTLSMELSFYVGNPGFPGTFPAFGTLTLGSDIYTITGGYATISKFPNSLPKRIAVTFSFTATGSAGTVEVSNGVLSIWLYETI